LFQYSNNAYDPVTGVRSVNAGGANPFAGVSGSVTLGATLGVNFFDTFNTWTATRDAQYELARLTEERRRVERVVDADVRTAHAKVMHLFNRRVPLVSARDVARDNVTILETRYKNGDALVIEFLDAQIDLGQAELNVADIEAQLYLAFLELEASLGRIVGAH
jgi:outer membrane protein TolC